MHYNGRFLVFMYVLMLVLCIGAVMVPLVAL